MPQYSHQYSRISCSPASPLLTSAGQNLQGPHYPHLALLDSDDSPLISFQASSGSRGTQELKCERDAMDIWSLNFHMTSTTARHSSSILPEPTGHHLLDPSNSKPDANSATTVETIASELHASDIDDDPYVKVGEENRDPSVANIHRCPRLLPITLGGSPSPIEPLPPPFLPARAPITELDEWRNSSAKDSYFRSSNVSGTVIGLGVVLPSLSMPQEVSLPTKTAATVASATPKIHSPLTPQRAQVRSPHCKDEGRNPGLSIASPLQKASPLHHSACRSTQASPTIDPILRHTGSHPSQAHVMPRPSSPDLKHLQGRTARKRPRSRSIRAPENTPPTPKSPQIVEKATMSPLMTSTNQLDASHVLLQGTSGQIQFRETFPCHFSGQDTILGAFGSTRNIHPSISYLPSISSHGDTAVAVPQLFPRHTRCLPTAGDALKGIEY